MSRGAVSRSEFAARVAHRALSVLLFLGLVLLGRPAFAWYEAHVTSDQIRVVVEPGGQARVEHRLSFQVAGGPMPFLDVRGVDADAEPEAEGHVLPKRADEQGTLVDLVALQPELLAFPDPAPGEAKPLPTLRLRFADKGLSRGSWVAHFRYRTDLVGRGLLAREGSMALLRWSSPVFDDGLDGARVVLQLPDAPTEPAFVELPDGEADGSPSTVVSKLSRSPGRDELELVRPYVPKQQVSLWTVRLDARAVFPSADSPPPVTPTEPESRPLGRARPSLVYAGAGLLFALLSGLTVWKFREVARSSAHAGARPRPLIPLPLWLRAPLAGLSLVGGVGAQVLLETSLPGALLLSGVCALLTHRSPGLPRLRRGPGRWLALKETEAFEPPEAPPPRAYLDLSTRDGLLLFAASLLVLGALVWGLARTSPYYATLAALDGVVLLALFGTGRQAELPRSPRTAAAPLLAKVALSLKKGSGTALRIVPRARLPRGEQAVDELRLLVLPRMPVPGLLGIEVGVLQMSGPGRVVSLPEVLVRFEEGSECATLLAEHAAKGRLLRGRRASEKVLLLSPRLPTAKVTSALVLGLAGRLGEDTAAESFPVG